MVTSFRRDLASLKIHTDFDAYVLINPHTVDLVHHEKGLWTNAL